MGARVREEKRRLDHGEIGRTAFAHPRTFLQLLEAEELDMARSTAVKAAPAAQFTAPVTEATPAEAPLASIMEVISWDDFPEPEDSAYVRAVPGYDPSKAPDVIKQRVAASIDAYSVDEPTANAKRQNCGTPARAEAFLKEMRKFAAHCEPRLTVRGGVDANDRKYVRYSVRPFEARDRTAK